MILILTKASSARIDYIFHLIFTEVLGAEVRITQSQDEFSVWQGPRLVYADTPIPGVPFIEAANLLFTTGLKPVDAQTTNWLGIPLLFGSSHPESCLPFDPFAAAFYLVSRYEEYLSHKKDRHGRFPHTESIAHRSGFLQIPVVHLWANLLHDCLVKHFGSFDTKQRTYRFVPTIDVDHAYAYLGRSMGRTAAGFLRSVMRRDGHDLMKRVRVLTGRDHDPYDSFGYLDKLHEPYGIDPMFFMLYASYGGDDNNVELNSGRFRELIRTLDQKGNVGIHPSLSSARHPGLLRREIGGLSRVLDRPVTISRQHFLKLSFPGTYRLLIQHGIEHDYSLGYASVPGFRAGIAIPFRFFDLEKDQVTPLILHPVTIMDVTLRDYMRLTPSEALKVIAGTIKQVRSVNGTFISLWHNESLGDFGRWQGWREVYEEMVREASQ